MRSAPGERIGRHAEHPLRQPELRRHRRQRLRRPRVRARSGRDSTSPSDRTRTRSLCRRATIRAGRSIPPPRRRSAAARRPRRRRSIVGEVQRGAVPRHVGMIPGEPDQPVAVGRQPRRAEEIVPADQHAPGLGAATAEIDGDDGVDRLAFGRCGPRARRSSGCGDGRSTPSANRQSRPRAGGSGVSACGSAAPRACR